MKRRLIWITVAVLSLLVLGTLAFHALFEEVPTTRHEGAQAEARRNPYLALERFLQRMQRPLTRNNDAALLDRLPPGGVLLLDANRRAHLTPARLDKLLDWVAAGGYVIATPEWRGTDLLLAHFDLDYLSEREAAEAVDEDEEEAAKPPRRPPKAQAKPPETIEVRVPGYAKPLQLRFLNGNLVSGEQAPAWGVEHEEWGASILHFSHGKGHVTILPIQHFNNHNVGKHDAAELLWVLLQTYAPAKDAPITLMTRLHLPTLGEWLAGPGHPLLIAGLLLLLLWLWRAIPRFGPIAPAPEPNRRQLREHLTAIGRYVWRAGGLRHWLRLARDAFFKRLALRQPAIAQLPPERLAEALARLTQRPPALVAGALYGPADSMHDFTLAMRTLRTLERSL